jgi:hypothetical protein
MGSLIEELNRREAAGRAEADRLRSRIEEFAEELARAEEQVSRLVIAREEVVLCRPHNGAMHVTDAGGHIRRLQGHHRDAPRGAADR